MLVKNIISVLNILLTKGAIVMKTQQKKEIPTEASSASRKETKLSFLEQFGYFSGDFGGSLVNLYISAFYVTFCTYVLGISPAWMATLIFVAKIWDAINDPMIGSLPDRFKIGKGTDKFKPWIKLFMVPLALTGLMCFTNTTSMPDIIKHAWVAVSYILYGMAYTGVSMPYGAMASVITDSPVERTKLSRARAFGGMGVGILFIPLVSLAIWDEAGNPNAKGYFLMAIVAGVLSVIFYLILLGLTKERIHQEHRFAGASARKYSLTHVVKEAFTNRALIAVMIASIGSMFASAQSMNNFLYKEYYHMPKAMAASSMISLPMMFVAFFAVPRLAKIVGNRKLIIYSAFYSIIAFGILFFIRIPNCYVFMFVNTVANLGLTTFTMLVWALVTESIDYQEYKTGERSDGTMYSIYTFSRKIGSAAAASISTALIGTAGFVAGAKEQIPEFGENIRKLVILMPLLGAVVILVSILLIYPLTKNKSDEMYAKLHEMHESKN